MGNFEKASRKKLRFDYKGKIATEDLWDVSIIELDGIYSKMRTEQKASSEDSLLKKETRTSSILNLKIELVRHVVETKLEEAEARQNRATAKLQKEVYANLIQEKKEEGLKSLSIEELQKAMEELKV